MGAGARRRDSPVYDSDVRPWPIIGEAVDLFTYRALVRHLIARNIAIRYKRSALGLAWTLLNPLLMLAVMGLAFSSIFWASEPNYVAYVLAGIVFWTFFAQTTTSIAQSLTWSGSLFQQVYLPRATFAVASLGSGLVNFLLALGLLVVVAGASGAPIGAPLLIWPVAVLFIALFALGIGLLLAAIAIDFADVLEIYQILLTMLLYLTPIFYPIEIVPESNRWLFNLNPLHHLLAVFREPVQLGRLASADTMASAGVIAVVTFVVGWAAFARKADEIPYRV
jgi:ABC-type polysaccharide/polyol phosphate export permease